MTYDDLPARFWWVYGCEGILGWAAVGLIWWRSGDFELAFDVVCQTLGTLASWAGYLLAMFWLGSTALMAALGLIAVTIMAVVWLVQRRGER